MRPPLPAAFLSVPIAHRGYHDAASGRLENAPAAFHAAIQAGYGIELDVQCSADGEAMVFHDETLDRMTAQTGPLLAHSAADLAQVRLGQSAETIPTLAQTLRQIAGRVPLLIEIKADSRGATPGQLEAAVARALTGYQGPVAVMSFNPPSIALMQQLAPDLPRGLTTDPFDPAAWPTLPAATCARLRDIPDYDSFGCSFISHKASDLARPRVAELAKAGAAILCWTIRSPEAEQAARRIAQNITFEGYAARHKT